jgi:hypothetical protein
VLEVSTPQLSDIVRIADRYGRADVVEAHMGTRAVQPAAGEPAPPEPVHLVDREQLAVMLSVSRRDVPSVCERAGFPPAHGYFRGRLVWERDSVADWLACQVDLGRPGAS